MEFAVLKIHLDNFQPINQLPYDIILTTMIVKPFCAYRPPTDLAADVCGPPYDVLNSKEARVLAEGNPKSILHVNKPEIDLDADVNIYDDEVYQKAVPTLISSLLKAT
ncbi:hypothetical protein GEMRC1_010765 [Eukaryota sp. GEM-RC1]